MIYLSTRNMLPRYHPPAPIVTQGRGSGGGRPPARAPRRLTPLEPGLGTFRGAVRVYPTPDDLANRCEIRVLDVDPHAGAIPWPGRR